MNLVEEVLERLKKEGLKISKYQLDIDEDTGETTVIVLTPTLKSTDKDLFKAEKIRSKIQKWLEKKDKNYFVLIIPTGDFKQRKLKSKRTTKTF